MCVCLSLPHTLAEHCGHPPAGKKGHEWASLHGVLDVLLERWPTSNAADHITSWIILSVHHSNTRAWRQADVKLHQTSSLHIQAHLHSASSPSQSGAVSVRVVCHAFLIWESSWHPDRPLSTLSIHIPAGFNADPVVDSEVAEMIFDCHTIGPKSPAWIIRPASLHDYQCLIHNLMYTCDKWYILAWGGTL